MSSVAKPVLETERLILRELVASDLDFLASMLADPDVSHHYDRRFSRDAADGWLLDRPHWGKGYATEAALAVRDAAFTRWKYPEVISLIRPGNTPSQRVAERIGMTPGPRVWFNGFEHVVYRAEPGAA